MFVRYILKDEGLPHYKLSVRGDLYNDPEYRAECKKLYLEISSYSIGKDKVELTNFGVIRHAYKHWCINFQPVYVSLLFVLTDMINSTIYVPSPKNACGRGLNRRASEAAWRCILRPKEVGKLSVADCFFEDSGRHWCHETLNEGDFAAEPEHYQDTFDYEGILINPNSAFDFLFHFTGDPDIDRHELIEQAAQLRVTT